MKKTYDGQSELPISRAPRKQDAPTLEQIKALSELVSLHGDDGWRMVYQQSIRDSGLTETEVGDALGIDRGLWSRTITQVLLQQKRVEDFSAVVGNNLITHVQAYREGYSLHPLETELEKQLRAEREERAALEQKLKHFEEYLKLHKAS